jgi:hypothetical protein
VWEVEEEGAGHRAAIHMCTPQPAKHTHVNTPWNVRRHVAQRRLESRRDISNTRCMRRIENVERVQKGNLQRVEVGQERITDAQHSPGRRRHRGPAIGLLWQCILLRDIGLKPITMGQVR